MQMAGSTRGVAKIWILVVLSMILVLTGCPVTQTVTVTFDANGGTTPSPSAMVCKVWSTYGPLATTTRPGYAFAGWWTSLDDTGEEVKQESYVIDIGDHTLYAKWVIVEYAVTYTLNGGVNNGANPSTYRIIDTPIQLGDPSRDGYDFLGWSLYEVSEIYQDTIPEGSTGDFHFYAQWDEIRYLLTFDSNGGTPANPATKWVTPGSTYGTLAATTKAGYDFAGWWTGAGGTGSEVTSNTNVTTAADHTLYAKWQIVEYDIEYVLNGGTNNAGNPDSYTILDTPITLLDPTKADNTFGGWFSDIGLTVAAGTIGAGSTGDKTVYAKWLGFAVGNPGPAGGYIFYDKGSYSDGWRYMEAAPYSVEANFAGAPFGYYRAVYNGSTLLVGGTSTLMGKGEENTDLLTAAMGSTAYLSLNPDIATSTAAYAAKLCKDLEYGGYSDWFLPSLEELVKVYENLYLQQLGGYFGTYMYWTSTENNYQTAYFVRFRNGTQYYDDRAYTEGVRPVRSF